MYFRLLHDEASGAVSYLLADLEAGEAVLIDPRGADVPVLAAMLDEHRLLLRWVLRTHEHDDAAAPARRPRWTVWARRASSIACPQRRPPAACWSSATSTCACWPRRATRPAA